MADLLISIIVPVYRVEPYIRQCMDSLIGQTYKNIEIICVDDGSPDNSGAILDEYAAKDDRVRPLHQENRGVAQARNAGIEASRGDYIMFVDGDDWVDRDCCQKSVEKARQDLSDVVIWGYVREFDQKSLPKLPFDNACSNDCAILCRQMFGPLNAELRAPENADSLATVWGKLYKASIIKDNAIVFCDLDRIGTYEDGVFNIGYFNKAQKASYIKECLYHYRKNSGMTAQYRPTLAAKWNNLFSDMAQLIKDHQLGAEYINALNNRISLSIIGLGLNATSLPPRPAIKNIRQILNSERYRKAVRSLPLKYFPLHWWVFFACCKLRLSLAVYILLKCMNKMRG